MTKREFLDSLRIELEKVRAKNTEDILNDYQEHFSHGLKNGKSEFEISMKLGSPATIAKAYETERLIAQFKDPETKFQWRVVLQVIGRLLVIAPFNFFVLFIPGVLIFSFVVVGWSIALALVGAGLAVLGAFFKAGIFSVSLWASVAFGSTSMAVFGLAVLVVLIMFVLSKYILSGLINYIQWNIKFVLEK